MAIGREDAAAIASLVKARAACQERIRIHRGKPMPGVLRPEKAKPRKSFVSRASKAEATPAPEPPDPQAAVKAKAAADGAHRE